MKENTKLIVLRGPSGSGKSSVALKLREQSKRKIAIIEQDYYPEVMFARRDKEDSVAARRELLVADTLIALKYGFDVILDGILSVHTHRDAFEKIIDEHRTENYMFYFDVSLEETLKRHATRPKASQFGVDEMAKWYIQATPANYDFEEKIPENFTLEQTVEFIKKKAGI